jgi:uncharacterized protein
MAPPIQLGLLILIAFFLTPSISFSDNLKSRMASRVPAIEQIKSKGEAIELESGYLQAISKDPQVIGIIDAENNDRKEVYTRIAKERGAPIEFVAELRAAQIRKNEQNSAGLSINNVTDHQAISSGKTIDGVPDDISKIIIEKCTEKWPDNFRLQKNCRDDEAKAWIEMN